MSFSEKQHREFLEEMKIHTAETIKATVNGKIAALDEKLTKRLAEQDLAIKPVIEAFEGGNFVFKVFIKVLQILALLVPAGAGFLLIKDYFHK